MYKVLHYLSSQQSQTVSSEIQISYHSFNSSFTWCEWPCNWLRTWCSTLICKANQNVEYIYVNLNINVLISTPEKKRPSLLRGHFSGAKGVASQEGFHCSIMWLLIILHNNTR